MQPLQSFVEQFTYLGVFLLLLAGSLGLPVPEEMAIFAAGVMSHEGLMAPWPGLLVCILGVLSGDMVLYWTGRQGGERVVNWRVVRFLLTPVRERQLKTAYRRHAIKTIVTVRHLMGLRAAAFLTAGIARVPFWKFVLADGGAASIGVPFSFGLAYFFTDHIKEIYSNVHRVERWLGLLVLVVVAVAVTIVVRRRNRVAVKEIVDESLEGHSVPVKSRREAKSVRLSVLVLAVALLSWSPAQAQDYNYPYQDPYLATVTGASLNADGLTPGIKRQVVHVPILRDRDKLPALEGRGALSVALYRQRQPAPLLFILPGTGSNPYFGLATYFAKLFYQQGSHVVILPSPMSWNFALAASRSGAPGYTPDDARDLYGAMQRILPVLQARYHVKVTRINLFGMSLGALEGAYLSCIDADEGRIGIARYLLVNPPLDVSSVSRKLDEWDALQEKFGPQRAKEIQAKALGIVEAFAKQHRDDPAAFDTLAKGFAGFSKEELKFLIAEYLQTVLPELVTVTQAIHDQRVLNAPKGQVRKRLLEAKGMTFTDYSDKIAGPIWRVQAGEPDTSPDAFTARGSLGAILERLKGNSRVFIMHNTDDVLSERQSIEQLKEVLGDQVKLYPYGGHMGNLWFPPNKAYVLGLLRN